MGAKTTNGWDDGEDATPAPENMILALLAFVALVGLAGTVAILSLSTLMP